jgi:hypothetical protein
MSQTDYRDWLVKAHHSACTDFDKAVMTLSGGALALSITFVHEVAPNPTNTGLLGLAWGFFAASLACVFASLLTTQGTLVGRIAAIDANKPWGFSLLGTVTTILGVLAGVTFLIGLVMLSMFAHHNI